MLEDEKAATEASVLTDEQLTMVAAQSGQVAMLTA